MSDIQDLIHRSTMVAYEQGVKDTEEAIIKRLLNYFDLTRFSEEVEKTNPNPEWDAGYQAAIAIAKGKE